MAATAIMETVAIVVTNNKKKTYKNNKNNNKHESNNSRSNYRQEQLSVGDKVQTERQLNAHSNENFTVSAKKRATSGYIINTYLCI